MGRLVREPLGQPVPVGDVLDDRGLEPRVAVRTPDQRHGQLGPDRRAVGAEEPLLRPERLAPALDQLAVVVPDRRGVVRVQELGHRALAELLQRVAEHVHQGRVDVEDVAGHVADADPDGGVGEHRPEPRLARVQRRPGPVPGVQRGQPDLLLLGQHDPEQRAGVAGGDRAGQRRQPRVLGRADHLPAEHRHGPVQRGRVGEVGPDQRLADLLAGAGDVGGRVVGRGGHGVGQPPGQLPELAPAERDEAGALQCLGPGPGQLVPRRPVPPPAGHPQVTACAPPRPAPASAPAGPSPGCPAPAATAAGRPAPAPPAPTRRTAARSRSRGPHGHRRRGALVEPAVLGRPVGLLAGRRVREGQVAPGRHRVPEPGHQPGRVVLVRHEVQHRDHEHRGRPAQVEHRPYGRVGQHRVRVAQVRLHDRGPVVAGEDRVRVLDRDRVVVDVHDRGVRGEPLRDLVHVAHGRDPGAEVEELPHPGVDEELDRPAQEAPVGPHDLGQFGPHLDGLTTHLPVSGEVVEAAEIEVVDPSR